MTPEQKPLILWGGIAGAAALLAIGWIAIFGDTERKLGAKADKAYAEYAKLYPAAGGESATVAQTRIATLANLQYAHLAEAERTLVGTLPQEYQIDDLNQATNQVRLDLERLRQAGLSRRIVLPPLPFQGATLAQDQGQRRRQLAELWFLRRTVEILLEAGVSRISQLASAGGGLDPDGVYGVLLLNVACDAPQPVALDLLNRLRQEHVRGLGLRDLAAMPSRDAVALTMRLSLILPAKDCVGFGLAVEPAAPALDPVVAPEAGTNAPAARPLPAVLPAGPAPAGGAPRSRFGSGS